MQLSPGRMLLHYRLVDKLGEGGMGVVWKAVDTTLGRGVALKVLPEAFAADADRLARFEREAKVLAALNHRHIASIHGLHQADGARFLTMELVEGEDLAKRLARGALSVEESMRTAAQLAEGIEAAHEQGVVHRDLKPANIILTGEGEVKILDFGLAKALEPDPSSSMATNPAMSPTLTSAGTVAGMILGTAAYMSPEQARGRPADRRADIWAFGCILYEMLTASVLFAGETVSDTLAAVLRAEPDWTRLPRATPRAVTTLLDRCLDRDRRTRLQAIGEARVTLERTIADPLATTLADVSAMPVAPEPRYGRLPWAVAAVFALIALWLGVSGFHTPEPVAGERIQASLLAPEGVRTNWSDLNAGAVALSPDGRYITFAVADERGDGLTPLWVRGLDGSAARPLAGTEGGRFPFWSPDSKQIAFFIGGKLKRVDLEGSPPATICDAENGRSGGWNAAGQILFSPSATQAVHLVPARGGTPTRVTELDAERGESTHRWATFLPDGRHFLYMAGGHGQALDDASQAIWLQELVSDERTLVVQARSNPLWADGHVLYVRDRVLTAQRFDLDRRAPVGDPMPIADGLLYHHGLFRAGFTAAPGLLAYLKGEERNDQELHWVDVSTATVDDEIVGQPARMEELVFSRDGETLAVTIRNPDTGATDIWLQDLERGVRTRVSYGEQDEAYPVFSPDGRKIAYLGVVDGNAHVRMQSLDASADPHDIVTLSELNATINSWTADGRLVVTKPPERTVTQRDIYSVTVDGGAVEPVLATPFNERALDVSPGGRWLFYISNESGTDEGYLTRFPRPGRKWQVSTRGALAGYFVEGDAAVMFVNARGEIERVPVRLGDATVDLGAAVVSGRLPLGVTGGVIAPDGKRALVILRPPNEAEIPITLVWNWARR